MKRLLVAIGIGGLMIWPLATRVVVAATLSAPATIRLAEADEETWNETDERADESGAEDAPAVTTPAPSAPTNAPAVTTPAPTTPNVAPIPESIQKMITTTTVTGRSENFPWAWVLTRSAGIASYLLLFLMAVTGMLITTGAIFRVMSPGSAWSFHRAVSLTMVVSVVLHLAGTLFDTFVRFRPIDILVPFIAPYRPLWVGLGVMSFYLLLFIVYMSVYQIQKKSGFWRFLHFFSLPMYVALFLHGIMTGTDAKQPWMVVIYWTTGSIVGLLMIYRLVWRARTRKIHTTG